MIRVVVADDHAVVLTGIVNVLENAPEIVVAATAANGREAVAAVVRERPDVVLMDLEMPVLDGIEATREIARLAAPSRVVVLTAFSDQPRILAALDAGAVGYLLKDAAPQQLVDAIRAAAAGAAPLDPRAARTLLAERRPRTEGADLTLREREVVALVGRGYANKRIAYELGISEKTVKTHLTSAFRRIGVFDRTQAALWAEREGLVADR